MYGALKSSIENHLWAAYATHGLSFVSLRPSAVYGIDPRLERSIGYPILQGVAKGNAQDRKGGGKFVHVDDVAASVVSAARRQVAEPGIYHLADCYARWAEWARLSCEVLGTEVDIDDSSPTQPRNQFNNALLEEELGITLDRGFGGIRDHLHELSGVMQDAGVL
jgi:nucleoside-diphosphate-sugar epimerase